MDFAEITPDDEEPPPSWVERYGAAAAATRLRIAKCAWRSAKDAPVGIRVATQIASSIIKSRSMEKAAPKQLSVTWIQQPAPAPERQQLASKYPEIVVESE